MTLPQELPIAAEMYEAAAKARGENRGYLGMSGIGEPCSRKLWYSFRGYTPLPLDGRAAMIFDLGSRVEDAVVHWLTEAGYGIEDRQLAFSDFGGFFRGHCDGVIGGVTSRPHILEIKSANDKKFKAFRECGIAAASPAYAAQVQCYMGYSGLDRALWVVMNKDTCEIYTERAYFDREEFERLKEKARVIITADTAPDPSPYMCEWCEFRVWCKTPDLAIQETRTCGTCFRCAMNGDPSVPGSTGPFCSHARHRFPIKTWGAGCEDWIPAWEDAPF